MALRQAGGGIELAAIMDGQVAGNLFSNAGAQAREDAPTVLVLVPDMAGGIRRLFEQMQAAPTGDVRTQLRFFASHDDGGLAVMRFAGRLMRFWQALDGVQLCHINLSVRGSTLRKLFYALLCRWAGVPYVLHLHGSGYDGFFRRQSTAVRRGIRWLFAGAARVMVLGAGWRSFVIGEIGVAGERVVVLPNAAKGPGAAMERDASSPAKLLFLGRVGARKGVPELLDALAGLADLNWTATIAGDGAVAAFRAQAAALGLDERVAFSGWVDDGRVQTLLAEANVLVLPSHAENLPLSLLEGMGHGLCAVVTPVGAVGEVIRDEENGLLVPVEDVVALRQALERVCRDGAYRRALGRQARADFLVNYDIADYRQRLESVYGAALAEASGE